MSKLRWPRRFLIAQRCTLSEDGKRWDWFFEPMPIGNAKVFADSSRVYVLAPRKAPRKRRKAK